MEEINTLNKNLIILRGLPGAGKTTVSKLISPFVCSADDYLYTKSGEYVWTPERVHYAHKKCIEKCEQGMSEGLSTIVIANTSPKTRDMKPYRLLAEQYGYRVFTLIVENRHNGVNSHNVTEDHIEKMKQGFNIQL